jgi:hypothetical protein
MAGKVGVGSRFGQYPAGDPVQIVARATGKPLSVAAQLLKPSDPRCPFTLSAEITAALWANGRGDVAARLRLSIDLAAHAGPVEHLADLLVEETRAEGAENEAQQVFSLEAGPAAWATLRRRFVREMEVTQLAIAAGDREYGVA